jgi:hypothetical protein
MVREIHVSDCPKSTQRQRLAQATMRRSKEIRADKDYCGRRTISGVKTCTTRTLCRFFGGHLYVGWGNSPSRPSKKKGNRRSWAGILCLLRWWLKSSVPFTCRGGLLVRLLEPALTSGGLGARAATEFAGTFRREASGISVLPARRSLVEASSEGRLRMRSRRTGILKVGGRRPQIPFRIRSGLSGFGE